MNIEEIYNIEEYPRRRWAYPRDNERNYVAAFFHAMSAILTAISLLHLSWFRIFGGMCTPRLGLYQFMRLGYFESSTQEDTLRISNGEIIMPSVSSVTIEYHTGNEVLQCITPEVLNLMRVLVMLALLCIFCSMVGFSLDMIGPSKSTLRFIRRNALPSTWAVLIIITMVGVSYLVSNAMEYAIGDCKPDCENKDFRIAYEYGVYTVTTAGAVSLLATACNLLQDPSSETNDPQSEERLVEDFDNLEPFSVGMRSLPPPPPYTP